MEFLQADEELQEQFAADIPELVHATGPVSYDYHFPKRAIFDALVTHSWRTPGTLFSAATTRLAIDEGKLLGIVDWLSRHRIPRADCGAQSGMGRAADFRYC